LDMNQSSKRNGSSGESGYGKLLKKLDQND